jgi:hypothetical protein
MPKHSSDLNSTIFRLSYNQISFYLKANGWVHEKTVDGIDIFSFEANDAACKMLLPQDDQSADYKHRLADILLVLQMLQSPSIEDISHQIKQFCVNTVTQENYHE